MVDIFISYAKEDRLVAENLSKKLCEEGWDIFWDRKIEAGSEWNENLLQALHDARCVIVLWSTASRKSF